MDLPSRLLPTRGERGDYAVTRHYFRNLPQGVAPTDLLDPDFWQHVARTFRVDDEIVALAADGSFDAELRVIELDPRKLWARVRVLRMTRPEKEGKAQPATQWPDQDGYTVEHGGVHKFRIVNRGGEVVAKGFPDEEGAKDALANIKQAKKAS